MISVAQAHQLIQNEIKLLPTETVSIAAASGRVLAEPIHAPFPLPRFTNAAMDGFAVRARDLIGASRETPVTLPVCGVIACGDTVLPKWRDRSCIHIMTGALIPDGADAVVMVEHTSGYADDEVHFYRAPHEGDHIRRQGEELSQGTQVMNAGTRIDPFGIGVLASFGIAEIKVARAPRVALLSTGNELKDPGESLAPGEIYNSNKYLLAELIKQRGCELVYSGTLRDDLLSMTNVFQTYLSTCDVIISVGGVSMGRFDLVRDGIEPLGLTRRFWKVAQKPGKPLVFASNSTAMFFGLPGNPVSSLITYLEYVDSTLMELQGGMAPQTISVKLGNRFPRDPKLHRFLLGHVSVRDGVLVATATEKHGSHMLTSTMNANAILEAEPGDDVLQPGELISARMLRDML